jgi:hypothetical protein
MGLQPGIPPKLSRTPQVALLQWPNQPQLEPVRPALLRSPRGKHQEPVWPTRVYLPLPTVKPPRQTLTPRPGAAVIPRSPLATEGSAFRLFAVTSLPQAGCKLA